jgi:hypothetical protein
LGLKFEQVSAQLLQNLALLVQRYITPGEQKAVESSKERLKLAMGVHGNRRQ